MTIKRYDTNEEAALFELIEREGEEWEEYHRTKKKQYQAALGSSLVYVVYDDDVLCGYCRCRDDSGFGVYVYDLLVDKAFRGKGYGRALLTQVCNDFPNDMVYVMSDVDPYYEKQGYEREGSIFIVKP